MIVVDTTFKTDLINMPWKRNLSAFILLFLLEKLVLDWLRLFDTTSFTVTLITSTFYDMVNFLVILIVIIIFFG